MTPMMAQYQAIKEENKDKVLFFRLGDFYEMFEDDALEVSRLLNLTLTQRVGRPMCGIPFHAAKVYIRRLLEYGKKIAICEQMELTGDPKKIARREVIQVITPATVTDDDFLDACSTSYLCCIKTCPRCYSLSYADITSGEFIMTTIPLDRMDASLLSMLEKIKPREILVNEDDYFTKKEFQEHIDGFHVMVTKLPNWSFKQKENYQKLCQQLGTVSLKAFGFDEKDPALLSGGALLSYLQDTSKATLKQITGYRTSDDQDFLQIDEASQRNLELLTNLHDGSDKCTLFSSIKQTITSGGTRQLKQWISFPLRKKEAIEKRQDWVTFFVEHSDERKQVRKTLSMVLDIQRLTTRIAMHRSYPQDLVGIEQTVERFIEIVAIAPKFQECFTPAMDQQSLSDMLLVLDHIKKGINPVSQGPFAEGEVIQQGYNEELDALRDKKNGGKETLDAYLQKIKEETGITTMKLSSNKIIGHYIEVSKGQIAHVPASFYRKQTLVNAERFTTDELVSIENDLLQSRFEAETKEKELYEALVAECSLISPLLQEIAQFLSTIDCLSSLAECAVIRRYHKPEFVDEDCLEIVEGRHPVVEQQLSEGDFVANPLTITSESDRFCLITGPNMAGKSTYLRQNALIVLLAQIGSYVPATKLTMSPVDRLFCRVGASDNLARGESTFLVEMQEAALILRSATRSSLVIVDELGRGTSSQDGMAIAYAVMKELVLMESKTLFATHYHELADMHPEHVNLLTLKVLEEGGKVIFLRKVIEGVAESSYGLNVAKLAGIPYPVLREALSFQKRHGDEYLLNQDQPSLFAPQELTEGEKADQRQLDEVRDLLDHYDVNTSSPLDALNLVIALKKKLQLQ